MIFTWNDEPLTDVKAIIMAPVMGIIFALIGIAFFGSAMALGLWIHSFFRPSKIEYVELDSSTDT